MTFISNLDNKKLQILSLFISYYYYYYLFLKNLDTGFYF